MGAAQQLWLLYRNHQEIQRLTRSPALQSAAPFLYGNLLKTHASRLTVKKRQLKRKTASAARATIPNTEAVPSAHDYGGSTAGPSNGNNKYIGRFGGG
jgi:hypothetical protein